MKPLTRDDFKVWSLADRSHSVSKYMCIAKQNPEQVVDQIIVNQEDAIGFQELIKILIQHCGEAGEDEGAVETLNRIIKDAEKWNRSKLLLDKNQDIVTLLKKLLEPYPKGNFDIDAPEDCADACREIQKILGENNV